MQAKSLHLFIAIKNINLEHNIHTKIEKQLKPKETHHITCDTLLKIVRILKRRHRDKEDERGPFI